MGKIIFDTANVNPATYLRFGTWEYWGSGKVPVEVDARDTDFSTVEKTGGEKTHKLTIEEMPSHNHTWGWKNSAGSGNSTWNSAGSDKTGTSSDIIGNTGGGKPHNNMPPYVTCYMWKRVS